MGEAIFLYGTLLCAPLLARVAGAGVGHGPEARLADHAVLRVAGTALPMLVPAPGRQAEGRLLTGLSPAARARLDAYELPFGYALRPVTVETAGGPAAALAYFPPEELVPDSRDWRLADWEAAEGAVSLLAAEEIDSHDPPLDGPALARQWGMIRARAFARARGRAMPAPAALRHAAAPEDHAWRPAAPLAGGFFKLATLEMAHRRFDGGRQEGLRREAFVGVDAALVLPYDPVRDVVLLVEQFRAGVARRGDPNPWTLEPVAGIVDAGETPEEAARRETAEEAGLDAVALRFMFSIYPSPGSSTDHFYCWLGLADLPEGLAARGGLAEEGEDIRLHRVARTDALALIDSGEINAGPLVAMLYWLDRHRARLAPAP